jgi:hypothetical protein
VNQPAPSFHLGVPLAAPLAPRLRGYAPKGIWRISCDSSGSHVRGLGARNNLAVDYYCYAPADLSLKTQDF